MTSISKLIKKNIDSMKNYNFKNLRYYVISHIDPHHYKVSIIVTTRFSLFSFFLINVCVFMYACM